MSKGAFKDNLNAPFNQKQNLFISVRLNSPYKNHFCRFDM